MKGAAPMAKDRINEQVGAVSGNDELRAGGQAEQARGQVKQIAERGVRHVEGSALKLVGRAKDGAHLDGSEPNVPR